MSKTNSKRRLGRAVLAAMLGMAVVIGSIGARAAGDEEEDVAPDIKAIRGFLHALGLRKDGTEIEYRERSPLVVPPVSTLPPPETGSAKSARNVAGWPDDPDIKRERKARVERRKLPPSAEEQERVLSPSELNIPTPAGGRTAGAGKDTLAEDAQNPLSAAQLGAKSMFSRAALGLGLGDQKERATFTREPQRSTLTEPPPGYRTPSPNQPYGLGNEPWKPSDVPGPHEDVR
jgi:hypothetical protein